MFEFSALIYILLLVFKRSQYCFRVVNISGLRLFNFAKF